MHDKVKILTAAEIAYIIENSGTDITKDDKYVADFITSATFGQLLTKYRTLEALRDENNKFYEKFENRIKDSYNILISTMYEMGVHVLHLDDFTNIAWALTGVDPFGSTNYERDTEDNSSNLTETKMRNKARDMLYFAPKVYSRQENEELKPRLYAFLNQHLKPIEELEKEHEEEIKASELEQEKKRKKNK